MARSIKHQDVLDQLYDLFLVRGTPEYIRSDNAPEFTAKAARKWLAAIGVSTLFIGPGSPWGNGYVESFIGKFRDELLNGGIFDALLEARVVIECWRKEYNQFRPHSSLGYKPPAPWNSNFACATINGGRSGTLRIHFYKTGNHP